MKYTAVCELCKAIVFKGGIRSMSAALGRHRENAHPDHKGSIKYKTTPIEVAR